MSGGSQAVRLPSEFRFDGDEVEIRRDAVTGDIILSRPRASWDEYFAWASTLDLPADFLARREQPTEELRDPFEGVSLSRTAMPSEARLPEKASSAARPERRIGRGKRRGGAT